MSNLTYDGVVAASGGDYTTMQAADDDLDAGAFSVYVKNGSYAGWTTSTNNARFEIEPGTTITSDITLSGNNIEVLFGCGCDIQGLLTMSGTDICVTCEDGCDFDGVLMSGARGFFDGGGWDTLSNGGTANHGISVTADDCIAQNARCQTTAGGGQTKHGVNNLNPRATFRNIQVVDSDYWGIYSAGADTLIEGCVVLASDLQALYINAACHRVVGCYATNDASADIFTVFSNADDSVLLGNVLVQTVTNYDTLDIAAAAENCAVVGNRVTGASGTGSNINDQSGTSTVADNDTT